MLLQVGVVGQSNIGIGKSVTLEYLPMAVLGNSVEGPKDLWTAGKCLSAEPRSQASA